MADKPKDVIETAEEMRVPEELLQQLHASNERLHAARQRVEKAMAENEYGHQISIDRADEELKAAEREIEEITVRIHGMLKPPPGPSMDVQPKQ